MKQEAGKMEIKPPEFWIEFWKAKYFEALNDLRAANRGIARLAKRRDPKVVDTLEALTGMGTPTWVALVNSVVGKHSRPAEDAPQRTHVYAMYSDLLDYVRGTLEKRSKNNTEPFDHVVATAQIIAWTLGVWARAVTRAKAFDPARPMAARRKMIVAERKFARAMSAYLLHGPEIREPWAGQEWENPFSVPERKEVEHE